MLSLQCVYNILDSGARAGSRINSERERERGRDTGRQRKREGREREQERESERERERGPSLSGLYPFGFRSTVYTYNLELIVRAALPGTFFPFLFIASFFPPDVWLGHSGSPMLSCHCQICPDLRAPQHLSAIIMLSPWPDIFEQGLEYNTVMQTQIGCLRVRECLCVCVCVCVRERERERAGVK